MMSNGNDDTDDEERERPEIEMQEALGRASGDDLGDDSEDD